MSAVTKDTPHRGWLVRTLKNNSVLIGSSVFALVAFYVYAYLPTTKKLPSLRWSVYILLWVAVGITIVKALPKLVRGKYLPFIVVAAVYSYVVYKQVASLSQYAAEVSHGLFWVLLTLSLLGLVSSVARTGVFRKALPNRAHGLVDQLISHVDLYRQRFRLFYYIICALLLSTVLMVAMWGKWWQMASQGGLHDPTAFMGIYFFMLVVQVVGVTCTLLLYREVRSERIETPADLFKVFHNAVAEAQIHRRRPHTEPVAVHHIAPFPGLFQLLHESVYVDGSTDTDGLPVHAVGAWRKYLEAFRMIGNHGPGRPTHSPQLVLSMVKYWVVNENGKRSYKGSSLYKFAVEICKSEPLVGPLLERARTDATTLSSEASVTPDGVIRYWYHCMVIKLLWLIDEKVKDGTIELYVRDVSWPAVPMRWRREHLGFTFVVTPDEAYIGLPEIRGGQFRFDGKRIDFQHRAVGELEKLVRMWTPSTGSKALPNLGEPLVKALSDELTERLLFDDVIPSRESI